MTDVHTEKIGTAPIIIDRLSRCMQAFDMPRMSRVVAIGLPHYIIQKGNHQECVSEDKDGLRQRLGCPRDYTQRNFLKIWVYCPTSKNH